MIISNVYTSAVIHSTKTTKDQVNFFAVSTRQYKNSAGETVSSPIIWKVNYKPRDPEEVHLFKKGANIVFEGSLAGDYSEYNGNLSANGPVVEFNKNDEPVAYLSVTADRVTFPGQSDLSQFVFVGNLGRDAEARYTTSGKLIIGMSLAVNRSEPDGTKYTDWIRLSWFAKFGEEVLKEKLAQLTKGKGLIVRCIPSLDEKGMVKTWGARDGSTRASWEFTVLGFQFCGGGKNGNGTLPDGAIQEPADDDLEDIPF